MLDDIGIATEDAYGEQWKMLARFSYATNIHRFFEKRGAKKPDDELMEYIAGCIRQSEAYFSASLGAPLDISPVLLYYGVVNLLAGGAALLSGSRLPIKEHGIVAISPTVKPPRIADFQFKPVNPSSGALQQFASIFSAGCRLVNGASWTLLEVLGSIPDLKRDFENCYPDGLYYTIPIQIVRKRSVSLERISRSEIARYETPQKALSAVIGIADAYLPAQVTNDYVILHAKLGGKDIGVNSIFGHKHLQIAHSKRNELISPDLLILILMGLFELGHLSRYHPETWNSFVRADDTGEKLIIERFMQICQRLAPNLVLNKIDSVRYQFSNRTGGLLDLSGSMTPEDLKEMLGDLKH